MPVVIKNQGSVTIDKLKSFYYEVYEGYKEILSGSVPLLHKMKELLLYMVMIFDNNEKITKKIKKAKNIKELDSAVTELFSLYHINEGIERE